MRIEKEIHAIRPLTAEEQSLVGLHSLLNGLNVLRAELVRTGIAAAHAPDLLHASIRECDRFCRALSVPVAAAVHLEAVCAVERTIAAEFRDEDRFPLRPGQYRDLERSRNNISCVLRILRVRAGEIAARETPDAHWHRFSLQRLQRNLLEFLLAQQAVTRTGYGIVTDVRRQSARDYCVGLRVYSQNGLDLRMPAELEDVIRDLVANARKYSSPGTHILASVVEHEDGIWIAVDDVGRGIPPDEIEEVVHFGKRASNVHDVRTMGGGFGLTKAFLVTRKLGGRFWISSELGAGTNVRLCVPRAAPVAA